MNPIQTLRARHSFRPASAPRFTPWLLSPALCLALGLLLAGRPALAANTLAVGSASGASGTSVTIPLSLDNDDVVKGVQADIQFDPAVVSYTSIAATARAGTMGFSASVVGGNKVRLVGYYNDANTLAAGTGAVANLTFQLIGAGGTSSALTLSAIVLSDPIGGALAVTPQNGSITVTGGGGGGQNVLAVGSASGASGTTVTIPLSLDNDDVVKGVQADIQFDPAVVSYTSIAATARAGTMGFSASVVGGNKVRLVGYYNDANTLAAGTGAIANLTFQLTGAGGTNSALTLSAIVLSDPAGGALAVTSQNGSITVTGGGGGGQNVLAVGSASGASGTTVTIPLSLDNDDVVKGVQADIQFDPAVVSYTSIDETARVGTMGFTASVVGGNKVRVVGYYNDANTLAAGTGAIANLSFQLVGAGGTSSALTPLDVLLSNAEGGALTVTAQAGAITVTGGGGGGQNVLAVGSASGASGTTVTIPLSLDNDDVVKGVQADIQFDPAVVSYTSIAATARAGTMGFSASVVGGNKVRLVGYYNDANTLAAGTGAVANLSFQLIGAGGTNSALTLSAIVLSDPTGGALAVTPQNGSITVTGGGGQQVILAMGNGSGASGAEVTVAMTLNNQSAVKALQTDLQFDPAVVSYLRGGTTGRAAAMTYGANVVNDHTVRLVIYYGATSEELAAGTGAIANLVFQTVGAGGTQSALTPTLTEVSSPEGTSLPVTNQAGSIQVTGGGGAAPVLKLAILKNPARTHTLQVFVTSDRDLTALPTVTVAGQPLTMGTVASQARMWQGTASLALSASSALVEASGTNGTQTGTAQVTVNF